jgi:hypothetical protein
MSHVAWDMQHWRPPPADLLRAHRQRRHVELRQEGLCEAHVRQARACAGARVAALAIGQRRKHLAGRKATNKATLAAAFESNQTKRRGEVSGTFDRNGAAKFPQLSTETARSICMRPTD